MIGKMALAIVLILCFAMGGCHKPVYSMASHTLKLPSGETRDVVWVVRDREVVYRCTLFENKPFCVRATFGKMP